MPGSREYARFETLRKTCCEAPWQTSCEAGQEFHKKAQLKYRNKFQLKSRNKAFYNITLMPISG